VSIRGFNNIYSDKLLVLLDGRTLYSRSFSGVFWDVQNILASDIDRIEVIRGPGGTAWGANAVNGVINIITKSAAETKGTLVEVGGGSRDRDSATVRYGGAVGNTAYRVYSTWMDHGSGVTPAGATARDRWGAVTTGLRADWSRGADSVTAQGSYMSGSSRPNWVDYYSPPGANNVSELTERVAAIRWTRRRASGALFQVQGFSALSARDESILYEREATNDVDMQYQTSLGSRHAIVAGGGYRDSDLVTRGTPTLSIPSEEGAIVNAFLEDDVAVVQAVHVTLGTKIEHDTFAGVGVLPSARAMWTIDARQRAWVALSRARRTPSASLRAIEFHWTIPAENGLPVASTLHGDPGLRSENLMQVDTGYRLQIGSTASVDVAAFRGAYDHSTTVETGVPQFDFMPYPHVSVGIQYGSLLSVRTHGVEVAGHWAPAWRWRVDGSYSALRVSPELDPSSLDAASAHFDGNAPQHQWQVHGTGLLTRRLQASAGIFRTGSLRVMAIPAYTRADARVEFKMTSRITAAVSGQNLATPSHLEFSDISQGLIGSRVPRTVRAQLRWQF